MTGREVGVPVAGRWASAERAPLFLGLLSLVLETFLDGELSVGVCLPQGASLKVIFTARSMANVFTYATWSWAQTCGSKTLGVFSRDEDVGVQQ